MSASSPHDRRWLCLFTQPHRERLALASLREDGFEVYLPLYSKSVLRNGKRTSMKAPLFPRYLFVAGADDAAFFSAARTKGVTSFAGRTLDQSRVCESIIRSLQATHDDDGMVSFDPARVQSGQSVKVLAGPFAGFDAVFAEANDRKRSVILLNLLGKTHRVSVPNRILEVAA